MKECPNCGKPAKDGWTLCPSCGIDLQKATAALGRDYYVPPDDGIIHPIDPTIPSGTEGEWSQRTIVVKGETQSVWFHDSSGLPTVHIPSAEESNLTEDEIAWVLDPEKSDLPPSRPSTGYSLVPAAQDIYEPPMASTSRMYVTPMRDPVVTPSDKAPGGIWLSLGMVLQGLGFFGALLSPYTDLVWFQIVMGIGILLTWLTIYRDAKSIGSGDVNNQGNFLTKIPPILWLVGFFLGWPWVQLIYIYSRNDIWQAYLRGRGFGY